MTPAIFPLLMRVRNLPVGGAVSVPITTSASSLKPSARCAEAVVAGAEPDPTVPPCAAVCVYPNLITAVRERLGDSGVKVAAVATGFPSGQYPTAVKVADVSSAVELGADEIDMVIDRGAFLSGRYAKVYDE